MDEKNQKRKKEFLNGFEKRKLLDKKKLKIESEKCLKITQIFQKLSEDSVTPSSFELSRTGDKNIEANIHKSSFDIPTESSSDLMCSKNKSIDNDIQKSSDGTSEICNSDSTAIKNIVSISISDNADQHLDVSSETEMPDNVDPFENLFIKPKVNELQTFFDHHPFQTVSHEENIPFKPK